MTDSSAMALAMLILTSILIVYVFVSGTYQDLVTALGVPGEVRGEIAAVLFVLAAIAGVRSYMNPER